MGVECSCGPCGRAAALAAVMVLAGLPTPSRGGEAYLLFGAGGSGKGMFAYAGTIWTPLGSLVGSGPVVAVWADGCMFDYRTDIGANSGIRVEATSAGITAEAGWQIAGQSWRIAALGGLRYRRHRLSPDDPGADMDDRPLGAVITLAGEVTDRTSRWGVSGNARYTFGYEEYWLQGRPFHRAAGGWRAGPEVVAQGGPGYDFLRGGVFVSDIAVVLPYLGKVYLAAEAGIQADDQWEPGPYAGLHLSFFY